MGTRKIFIYCLPVSVESPWPDPFAFCFLLPLPQGRVKLQEAENHVFLSPQPNIYRSSCLLWTTQAKGGILHLQELWEVLLILSGLLMFTSLLVSPIFCPLHPKGAAWYSCGVGGLDPVVQQNRSGGSWRANDAPASWSHHLAVFACASFPLSPHRFLPEKN